MRGCVAGVACGDDFVVIVMNDMQKAVTMINHFVTAFLLFGDILFYIHPNFLHAR